MRSLGQEAPVGPQGIHRKLAAILAADVAGYTRLMEEDGFPRTSNPRP